MPPSRPCRPGKGRSLRVGGSARHWRTDESAAVRHVPGMSAGDQPEVEDRTAVIFTRRAGQVVPVMCRNAIGEKRRGIAEFVTVDEGLYERDRGAYKARRGARESDRSRYAAAAVSVPGGVGTVAGFTIASTSGHRDQVRDRTTQNARSMGPSRCLTPSRVRVASCCRSARFSAMRLARGRKAATNGPMTASTSASITPGSRPLAFLSPANRSRGSDTLVHRRLFLRPEKRLTKRISGHHRAEGSP